MDLDFSVVTQSGVTHGEFASMVGVTRSTVHAWVHGNGAPKNKIIVRECAKYLKVLTEAVETGDLPGDLPVIYKGNVASRKRYLHDTLVRSAASLRAKNEAADT